LLYTSTVAPTYPLLVDTSIYSQNGTLSNVVISGSASSAVDLEWIVTDQLGTPRMIFDKTGNFATIRRHDYLPFGEELFAGTNGRTTTQGYTAVGNLPADGARQKFTLKERDIETGLDYFGSSLRTAFAKIVPLQNLIFILECFPGVEIIDRRRFRVQLVVPGPKISFRSGS
jgi:hypothetical protein